MQGKLPCENEKIVWKLLVTWFPFKLANYETHFTIYHTIR